MLQARFPNTPAASDAASDMLSLQHLLATTRALLARQFPVMLFVAVAVLGLAGLYVMTAPRQYTSTANLIIDSRKINMMQQQGSAADMPIESAMIDSQVEILKSDTIALAVIKDLRLVEDPEFVGSGGGLIGNVLGLILDIFPANPPSDYQLQRKVLDRFERKLKIKRLGLSYVIEIAYESSSPQRAAQVANAVAEAYIVDSLEAKYQASRRAAVWLQDRLKELRAQASTAERAVVDFKAKNNIVDAGGRLLTEQQLAEINSSATVARAQRSEAEARLSRITNILDGEAKAGPNNVSSPLIEGLATVTDTLNNPVIIKLRQQYLEIAGRESDWANRFGQTHLAVVNLRNQMREIRRSIADELRRTAESYKSDLEIAKAREASVQKSLSDTIALSNDTSQAQIVLRELESNAQSTRALADNFLQLYMVSVQQQSFPITEARVITPAAIPLQPSSPKTGLILLGAIAGGALLAGLVGFLRDVMDRVFRSAPQVETQLGLGCLATVPIVNEGGAGLETSSRGGFMQRLPWKPFDRPPQKPQSTSRPDTAGMATAVQQANAMALAARERRIVLAGDDVAGTVVSSPFSRFAESMRAIKIAADLGRLETVTKVLGITSSLPNEGKSTISKAVALASAQGGARILLIDGDIRNPSLSRRLTPEAKSGLVDVILGHAAFKDVVWTEPHTNLHFLPCVTATQMSNSADILASPQMERLFRELRDHYDRIILDLSPLAPVIDVRGTGRLVDSYIVVIEWARTRIDVVERTLADAPEIRQKLLGAVLNKVDMAVMNRYDLYRGNYYYNRYYQRYGYVD